MNPSSTTDFQPGTPVRFRRNLTDAWQEGVVYYAGTYFVRVGEPSGFRSEGDYDNGWGTINQEDFEGRLELLSIAPKVGDRVRIKDDSRLAGHDCRGKTGVVEQVPDGTRSDYVIAMDDRSLSRGESVRRQWLNLSDIELVDTTAPAELKVGDKVRVSANPGTSGEGEGYVSEQFPNSVCEVVGTGSSLIQVRHQDGTFNSIHRSCLTKVEEQVATPEPTAEPKVGDRVRLTETGAEYYDTLREWDGKELKIFRIYAGSYGIGPVDHEDVAHDRGRGWLNFHRRDDFEVIAPAEDLADWEKELLGLPTSTPAPAAPADAEAEIAKAVEEALTAYKVRVRETALAFGRRNDIDMDPLEEVIAELGLDTLPQRERKIKRRVTVSFDIEATLSPDADTESFDDDQASFIDESLELHNLDLDSILDGDWQDVRVLNQTVGNVAL